MNKSITADKEIVEIPKFFLIHGRVTVVLPKETVSPNRRQELSRKGINLSEFLTLLRESLQTTNEEKRKILKNLAALSPRKLNALLQLLRQEQMALANVPEKEIQARIMNDRFKNNCEWADISADLRPNKSRKKGSDHD